MPTISVPLPPSITLPPEGTPDKFGSNQAEFDASFQSWLEWFETQALETNALMLWLQSTVTAYQNYLASYVEAVEALSFTDRGYWVTNTSYDSVARDWVTQGGEGYVCVVTHTAGTFSSDLAAGKWVKLDLLTLTANLAGTGGASFIGNPQSNVNSVMAMYSVGALV